MDNGLLFYIFSVVFAFSVLIPGIVMMHGREYQSKIGKVSKFEFSSKEYRDNVERIKRIQSTFSVAPIFPEKTPHEVVSTGGRFLQKEGFRITENLGKI